MSWPILRNRGNIKTITAASITIIIYHTSVSVCVDIVRVRTTIWDTRRNVYVYISIVLKFSFHLLIKVKYQKNPARRFPHDDTPDLKIDRDRKVDLPLVNCEKTVTDIIL